MMDQECKFALIEFGENEKSGYVIIKGGDAICAEPMKAHAYWYPEDITNEEAIQEVNDLIDHYENVAILVPLLEHINVDILTHLDRRSGSEVSA